MFSFYVQQNNQEQANKTFKEAEDCIQEFSKEAIDYEKYLLSKSKYYALIGKPQEAYKTLLAYNKIFDSKIFNKHIATYSLLTQNVKSYKDRLHIDELNIAAGKKNTIIIVLICIVVIISTYVYYKHKISKQLQTNLNANKAFINELKTEKVKQLKLTEELTEKNLEKDFLMRGVLHDLLNPLTSLSLKLELLEFQYKKELQNYFDFDYFTYSISNMVNICNDLLEYSDFKAIVFNPEPFNLIEKINKLTQQVQYQLNNKNQTIQLQYPDSFDANVYLDRTKIFRLLLNIIVNAIKFSPAHATITINIQDKNEYFILSIIDQGIGMSEEMINRIFKTNNIVGTLGTKGEKSFGLGLYICNRIIIAHQGTIEVTSEPGKGSTFTITLPKILKK